MEKYGVFLEVTEDQKRTADIACPGTHYLLLLDRQSIALSSQELVYQRPGLIDRIPASNLNLPWLCKEFEVRHIWWKHITLLPGIVKQPHVERNETGGSFCRDAHAFSRYVLLRIP